MNGREESDAPGRIRILFVQRSIPPDHSAAGGLVLDLAQGLDSSRFDVTVLGSRIPADAPTWEKVGDTTILRVGPTRFSRTSVLSRLIGLAGAWISLAYRALRSDRPDVVVTTTDPPLNVVLGALVARYWRARHVHWAQDLYPDVAVAGGLIREGSVIHGVLEACSEWAADSCERIVVVGGCMARRLRARHPGRLSQISNWTRIAPGMINSKISAEYRDRLGAGSSLLVLYAGNLGVVHDFETLLDAAQIARQRNLEIVFGIVGNGPREQSLIEAARRRDLGNMTFLPSQPWEKYPSLLAAADVQVVSLRSEFRGLVVPSKIYDAAAAGRPIVFLGPQDCESADLVSEFECGSRIPNGAAEELVDCLSAWAIDARARTVMGENARKLAAHFNRTDAIREFSRIFERALPAPKQGH